MAPHIRTCESAVLQVGWRQTHRIKLRWDSPSTLKSANLVCHFFHELILPIFFECIHVHFPKKPRDERAKPGNGSGFLEFLAAGDTDWKLLQCTKAVVISGLFPYRRPEDVCHLSTALPGQM
jgi:hypothetical protein